MDRRCRAVVVSCMDYRFQTALNDYLEAEGLSGQYDLISLPGACQHYSSRQLLDMVELAVNLHQIEERVYVCHHEDCGAYGLSTGVDDQIAHQQKDMQEFAERLREKCPHLTISLRFFCRGVDRPVELGEI